MHFWLDMGVDGLRLDAIPYLVEREGTNNENLPETHAVLKEIRAELDEHYPDRMLLAEANQWPEDTRPYFGEGDECHMAFHFPLMPRMYMALAQEDRHPITDIIRQTPEIPETCQWAIFLRNHDELTLEMVTDGGARLSLADLRRAIPARASISASAAGWRRCCDNDRRKIELMNALLFSMPGTPVIYYGDETRHGRQLSTSATATACARRCSGRRTAMAASPAPTRNSSICRRSWIPSTASRPINVEAQQNDAVVAAQLDAPA